MTAWFAVFAASFLLVAVKAAQQLNVVHHRLLAIWPTGFVFACAEFAVVVRVAKGDPWVILPLWLGGALGCTASMIAHKRWRERDLGKFQKI